VLAKTSHRTCGREGNIAVSDSKVTIKRDEGLTEEYDTTGFEDVKAAR